MLALSAVVVLVPILQGLSQYSWNVSQLVTPSYSPPKVDFSMRFVDVKFEGGDLYATFELKNLGEVRMKLEGLNATAYGPDRSAIAPAALVRGVSLEPGAADAVLIRLSINEDAFKALASYIIEAGRVDLEVKGTVVVEIFGSRATMPITTSFSVDRARLGLPG